MARFASSKRMRVTSALVSIFSRSGCRRCTSSSRSRVPTRTPFVGRHRREPDADRVVLAIRQSLDRPRCSSRAQLGRGTAATSSAARAESRIDVPQVAIADARPAGQRRSVCSQPSTSRDGSGCAELRQRAVARPIVAVLEPLEIRPHAARRATTAIAGEVGQLVPVGVVRTDEDHRVVRRAAAERRRRADTARRRPACRSTSRDSSGRAAAAPSSL